MPEPREPLMRGYLIEKLPVGANARRWTRSGPAYVEVVRNEPATDDLPGHRMITYSDESKGVYPPRYTIYAFPPGQLPEPVDDTPEVAKWFSPEDRWTAEDLSRAGNMFRQWTDEATRGRVYAMFPCHDEQAVVLEPKHEVRTVVCRTCFAPYKLGFTEDGDGMWFADFYVIGDTFIMSRKRHR